MDRSLPYVALIHHRGEIIQVLCSTIVSTPGPDLTVDWPCPPSRKRLSSVFRNMSCTSVGTVTLPTIKVTSSLDVRETMFARLIAPGWLRKSPTSALVLPRTDARHDSSAPLTRRHWSERELMSCAGFLTTREKSYQARGKVLFGLNPASHRVESVNSGFVQT